MASPGISVSFRKTKDLTPQLKAALAKMKGSYVTVGVHDDAGQYDAGDGKDPEPVAKVALWLENGTQFMPARPFLAPTVAAKHNAIQKMMAMALAQVSVLHTKPADALRKIGFAVQVWVQNTIKSNVPPELTAHYLAERKRQFPEAGNRTLIASSLLLRSIRYVLYIDGKKTDDHQAAEGDVPQPLNREDARKAAAVDKAARAAQRKYGREHPKETKERFDRQRRVPRAPHHH